MSGEKKTGQYNPYLNIKDPLVSKLISLGKNLSLKDWNQIRNSEFWKEIKSAREYYYVNMNNIDWSIYTACQAKIRTIKIKYIEKYLQSK